MCPVSMEQDLRVSRLERQVRQLRLTAVGSLVLLMTSFLVAFASESPQVVRAERVELLDSNGVRHATLSADTAGMVLALLDARGRPSASLRLTPEPWLAVVNGGGREVAGLGAPRPRNLTE